MSGSGPHLTLRPGRCTRCGRCIEACPNDAIRVGSSYILIDWHTCDHCNACVEACDPKAIDRALVSPRVTPARQPTAPADVSNVVVASRAEAKSIRAAAEEAARAQTKAAKREAKDAQRQAKEAAKPKLSDAAARGAPEGAVVWTLVDAAVVLGVLLLTTLAKNAVLAIPSVALMPASGRTLVRAAVLAGYYGIQLGAMALLANRHGSRLLDAFGLRRARVEQSPASPASSTPAATSQVAPPSAERPSRAATAALVVLLFLGTEAVSIGYGLAVESAGWVRPPSLSGDLVAVFGGGGVGLLLSAVLVAIVAPFAEELAFRGVLMPALGGRMAMWPAVGVSAAVYAAYHVDVWLFFPMLVLGGALGWLAWTRRSLWAAIALHVLCNSAAVTAAYLVAG